MANLDPDPAVWPDGVDGDDPRAHAKPERCDAIPAQEMALCAGTNGPLADGWNINHRVVDHQPADRGFETLHPLR
jgi:hypothetical protein